MSKKILTEDLILERMENRNIPEPGSIDVDEMQSIVLKYYDADIKHDWGHANMYFYTSSTADGYELYIATEDDRAPYFDNDVYYYESDWFEKLPDAIRDGYIIHIDEHATSEYGYEDAILEVYEDYWNDVKEEIENDLIEEGYEWETDDE